MDISTKTTKTFEFPDHIFDHLKTFLIPTIESNEKQIMREAIEFMNSSRFNDDPDGLEEHTLRWHMNGIIKYKGKIITKDNTDELKIIIISKLLDPTFKFSSKLWAKSKKIDITGGHECIHRLYIENKLLEFTFFKRIQTLGEQLVWQICLSF